MKCFFVSASKSGLGILKEIPMEVGLARESRSRQVNLKGLGLKKGGLLDGFDEEDKEDGEDTFDG